jgi:hypothetical protein
VSPASASIDAHDRFIEKMSKGCSSQAAKDDTEISHLNMEYKALLVLWKNERPSVDPVRSSVDNLQKGRALCIVKYNIIPAVPHCPNQSTNSNSYSCFGKFVDPIQPISKPFFYISRWRHIESEVNNSPDQASEFAFKEEVLCGLFLITKGAFFTSVPISFGQVVLCQYLLSI